MSKIKYSDGSAFHEITADMIDAIPAMYGIDLRCGDASSVKIVPEGADFQTNEYLKVGVYCQYSNASAQKITNWPESGTAGMVWVLSPLGASSDNNVYNTAYCYRVRIYISYRGHFYIQTAMSGSIPGSFAWGDWKGTVIG